MTQDLSLPFESISVWAASQESNWKTREEADYC